LHLAHQLRSHPLRHYLITGDEIFQDPFHSPLPSGR
jgi:hypothetical protein